MYLAVVLLILFFLIGGCIYLITGIISIASQSPYVPTADKVSQLILSHVHPKRGATFVDLGAGDGRVVKIAQDKFKLKARGYEVNPFLRLYSRLHYNIELSETDLFFASIGDADIIYIYLFPTLIKRLESKLRKETKKGTTIISYSFPLEGFSDKLLTKVKIGKRTVFYYKM